jgi:glycosyltransferase involved in cell wall biosynthesis
VYVASDAEITWAAGHGVAAWSAHDLVWKHARAPYDLIVYQLGNSWCHDYMWPYVFQLPGLVVLHDGHLHHARAWSLLRRHRRADYRAEFEYSHPEAPPDSAAIGLAGFAGPVYYFWPMLRTVIESARLVAVHSAGLAAALEHDYPGGRADVIRMGVPDPLANASERERIRARHRVSPETILIAAYGGVTREKRIPQLLRVLAAIRLVQPDLKLILVGETTSHYDARADAVAAGVDDLVTITGYVPDSELPAYLAAADIACCLRWPTAQETSASWLRCLAAGLPTIVTDLAHQSDLPALDPRNWTVQHGRRDLGVPSAIAVAIDILDEDHSLGLALRRLVSDAALRQQLARAARNHWHAHHRLDLMAQDYDDVLTAAVTRESVTGTLPPHLRPNPLDHVQTLIAPFGLTTRDLDLDPS